MTRINVLEPHQLPTKYLIAEYHELPRCIKQKLDVGDEGSKSYHLGKGHMKWARAHSAYLLDRYFAICNEMCSRGITVNHPWHELLDYCIEHKLYHDPVYWNDYSPSLKDLYVNLERIKENEENV